MIFYCKITNSYKMKLTNLGSFCLIFLYAKHASKSEKTTTLRPPCWIFAWQARLPNVRCLATISEDQPPMAWTQGTLSILNFIPQINKEKKRKEKQPQECRRTMSYVKGYSHPNLYGKKRSNHCRNLLWKQLALQEEPYLNAGWFRNKSQQSKI